MKILPKIFLVLIVSLAIYSCKKSSTSTPTPTASTWTLNNVNYKGDSSYAEFGDVGSFDNNSDEIDLYFLTTPVSNGTYTVVSGQPATVSQVYIVISTASDNYSSTGVAGDKVTITISGGKVVASFSNISVIGSINTVKASGTIVAKPN